MTYGFQPLPGIPPNFTALAAMSAGLLPANVQVTNFIGPNQTLLSILSAAGATGFQFNANDNASQQATSPGGAVDLQTNMPESNLTFASPVVYGGA
jgi:hypothetical protein